VKRSLFHEIISEFVLPMAAVSLVFGFLAFWPFEI
jgi:hypothetical protein